MDTTLSNPPNKTDHSAHPRTIGMIEYASDQNENAAVDYEKPRFFCRYAIVSLLLAVSSNSYVFKWIEAGNRATLGRRIPYLFCLPIFLTLVALILSIFSRIRQRRKKKFNIGIVLPVLASTISLLSVLSWARTLFFMSLFRWW